MPLLTKKNGGKIVIVNLQVTKHDKKCDLKINGYIDEVMSIVCDELSLEMPVWEKPVVTLRSEHTSADERATNIVVDPELHSLLQFTRPERHFGEPIKTEEKDSIAVTLPDHEHVAEAKPTFETVQSEPSTEWADNIPNGEVESTEYKEEAHSNDSSRCVETQCSHAMSPVDGLTNFVVPDKLSLKRDNHELNNCANSCKDDATFNHQPKLAKKDCL